MTSLDLPIPILNFAEFIEMMQVCNPKVDVHWLSWFFKTIFADRCVMYLNPSLSYLLASNCPATKTTYSICT